MITTSQSEIKLARRCLKAHEYKYIWNIQRKQPSRPAFVGTILHEMLDALAKLRYDPKAKITPWDVHAAYEKNYAKLFKAEKEEFGDVPHITSEIFEGYMRRWKGDGLKPVASEVEVVTHLVGKIHFKAKLDIIVVDRGGRRFLCDHKFHKNLPGPDERFSDIQTILYWWAWNREHKRADQLDGILWDYGRMKAPTVPELLKSGKALSQRMNIDTDQFTYLREIKRHGFKEKPYAKILKALEGKERTFFERVPLAAPNKHMVERIVADAVETTHMVHEMAKRKMAPRSMSGFNCNNCEFRRLCEAEVRGLDAKFVQKKDYEPRKDKEPKKYEEAA